MNVKMATHRYWRVYIESTHQGTAAGFAEIELRSAINGSDLTGSGLATASGEASGSLLAINAVDNNTSTEWAVSAGFPQWWKYDFGSGQAYDIIQFAIRPRAAAVDQAPKTFELQYSDDNSSWTAAARYVIIPFLVGTENRIFNVQSRAYAAHRYWRVFVGGVAGSYITVPEFELRQTAGGADLTGSGTATALIETSGGAANAVDNNTGTYWATFPNNPAIWWKYDFGIGQAYNIAQLQITPHAAALNEAPRDFTLEYSDDNATWTVAGHWDGTSWPSSAPQTFTLTSAAIAAAGSTMLLLVG